MKRKLCVAIAAILTIPLLHGFAFAGGWGPYFSWGREEPSTGLPGFLIDEIKEFVPDSVIQELEAANLDLSLNHLTFGIMYDSAPARDKLMGYRGTLGFDIATESKIEDVTIANISLKDVLGDVGFGLDEDSKYGLSTNHTLAFGIIRTDRLKWWAGPGIGLTFNYYDIGTVLDIKAANLSIGGGGETGVNIHLGSSVTLCVGGGIHWRAFGYGGGSEDVDLGSFVWGNGPFFFIQTSILFRTGYDKG